MVLPRVVAILIPVLLALVSRFRGPFILLLATKVCLLVPFTCILKWWVTQAVRLKVELPSSLPETPTTAFSPHVDSTARLKAALSLGTLLFLLT